jgi:hypothetical protein
MTTKPTNSFAALGGSRVRTTPRMRKLWWVLPLVVLIVLVAFIYVLSHLSAVDSEMYPNTMLRAQESIARLC